MSSRGQFVWYDLWTTDQEAARAFYTKAVGWGTQAWGGGAQPYVMWTVGDTPIGGAGPLPDDQAKAGVPPYWAAFVSVRDADATARRAEELGGTVRVAGTDIPEVGRFAVIADPQGAVLALLQPQGEAAPFDASKPGFVAWHELHTTDYESAWGFYSELFGWKHASTMDMGEAGAYFIFRHPDQSGEASLGGMFNPDAMTTPPYWLYYFHVADLEAALDRIRSAGGEVLAGPMDVPGGRVAPCKDPQGGRFAVFAPQ